MHIEPSSKIKSLKRRGKPEELRCFSRHLSKFWEAILNVNSIGDIPNNSPFHARSGIPRRALKIQRFDEKSPDSGEKVEGTEIY